VKFPVTSEGACRVRIVDVLVDGLNSMSNDEEQELDKIQSTAAAARHFQEYTCLVYVWMRPSKQLFIFAMERNQREN
jgi:hypothetical protein